MRLKCYLIGAAIILLGQSASAQNLQTPDCTAANIASTAESIAKMKDGDPKKTTASSEVGAASEALAQGKADDCQSHLLKAKLQTK